MSSQASAKSYVATFFALLVLTVITVALSLVHMGRAGNIGIGLVVAVVKATAVVLFFMHLKYEPRWWLWMVLFPAVLVMIIIFSNFADTAYGDFTHKALIDNNAGHGGRAAGH
jgi:cytochrome c oxidase subunit 4